MFKLKGKVLWRWKSTIIDFSKYDGVWDDTKETPKYKISQIMRFLPVPTNTEIHEWENGAFSSEYNWSLQFAFDLDLVEVVHYIEELDIYLDDEQFSNYEYYTKNKERN